MRVWQAAWDNRSSQLVLWAESGSIFSEWWRSGAECAGGVAHPFAASEAQLVDDLDRMEFEPDERRQIEIILPADDRGPLSSKRLLAARDIERGEERAQRTFIVPALVLDATPAIGFLSSLPSEALSGILLDDSLNFWREVTKLLLELLSRGSFLPTVQSRNGSYCGFWQVVAMRSEDDSRLIKLSQSIPPICGSIAGAPTLMPRALIDSFLAYCGDALIRAFLRRNPIDAALPPPSERLGDSSVREWVSSLSREDSRLMLDGYDAAKFHQRMRRWAGPVMPETPQTMRLRFVLTSPENASDGAAWQLEYSLDAGDVQGQSVAASAVWDGDLGFLRFSEFTLQQIEEQLLKDLGKASMISAAVRRSLEQPFPAKAWLTTDEAYRFLRDEMPLLEAEGFGIVIPQWWQSSTREVGLSLQIDSAEEFAQSSRPSLLGLNRLVDFSWQISVGDSKLTAEQFKGIVSQKSPLVNIGGAWVELRGADVDATLSFLESQQETSRLKLIDALRLGLSMSADPDGLPVVSFEATGWVQRLLDADVSTIPEIPVPESFHGELRRYQREGLSWLSFLTGIGCGGCLADDMGLGKTIQFIALLLSEREAAQAEERVLPTLLIVPMSIIENWQREISRFGPRLKIYVHHGSARMTGEEFRDKVDDIDVVITTYNLAYRDEPLFRAKDWGRIALDEAQNIKNLNTKQTKSIRRIVHEQLSREEGGFCHRVALTGTPLENHLEELWSIFDVLNPGYLGTIAEFRSRFAYPIERYRDNDAADRLSKVVRPFVLRRMKSDKSVIDDLPEKIEMEEYTPLTEEQAALYQRVVDDMLPQVDRSAGIKRKGLVLSTITKLKQVCDHPRLLLKDDSQIAGRSGKLSRLEEILEVILAEGDRALVFTQYAQMGSLLKEHLQERFGEEVLFMYGGTPQQTRQKYVDYFQSEKGPRVFVLSLKVGGLGLNLTAANQIIHFDQWWNPAVHEQATDRAFRIGQRKNVQVRSFLCRGTLEERIAELLAHKRDLADKIVASTRSDVTQLSTNELRQLLELNAG
ncbi:MAG: DEAD/DEAH box helicase [Bdellovibrionales bacterium]|nr:DEAD/DEAH box helicase [Bdellovibrionales bacterium]